MPDLNELHNRREELRSELDRLDQEISQARRIAEEQGGSGSSGSPQFMAHIAKQKRAAKRPWK